MYTEDKVYTRRIEMIDGKERYFVSFVDALGQEVSHEVAPEVYKVVRDAQKVEARIARADRRYVERDALSCHEIDIRALREDETTERAFFHCECIKEMLAEIDSLPALQRKRMLLRFVDGMTIREIASLEGCTNGTAHRTIVRAEKKLEKIYKKFFD